jgi:hypothetical protein
LTAHRQVVDASKFIDYDKKRRERQYIRRPYACTDFSSAKLIAVGEVHKNQQGASFDIS